MSLACFECQRIGEFDTLVIFEAGGVFDLDLPISHYANFYTCCAGFGSFNKAAESEFMVVQTHTSEDRWNTGSNGPPLKETKYKRISASELEKRLPKIFYALKFPHLTRAELEKRLPQIFKESR